MREMTALEDRDQPVSESYDISIRHEHARQTFFDGFRKSADGAGDDRNASNDGFERDQTERLCPQRRRYKHPCRRELPLYLGRLQPSEKGDLRLEVEIPR
jgi:hypothetical protein